MHNEPKRIYKSEIRHKQAAQTKNRILETARKLLQSDGFEYMTIEKLAQHAKVSMPTIYALFQSKRGILRALMNDALPIDQREALVKSAYKEKSPKARLMITAKIARQIYDAEYAQMSIFQGASVLAPEFKQLEKERELGRHNRLEKTIEMMVTEKSIAASLSASKAHDILWALTGRDLYRMFVVEQGWTSDEYEKYLAELLIKILIKND